MKIKISQFIGAIMCCVPITASAQSSEKITSPIHLYQEGKERFHEKNYTAAVPPLKAFMKQKSSTVLKQEAEYMLVCSAYELKEDKRISLLRQYLDCYPDTPYANRIYGLLASCYYQDGKYDEALALFNSSRLETLANDERDERTFQLASCYLKTNQIKEATIWFEMLRASSKKYAADCNYYLSYIRYTQKRYDEALKGFLPLQNDIKYKEHAPYYIAEIYVLNKNYAQAEAVAQNYLKAFPKNSQASEMYRILGQVYYEGEGYTRAVSAFENYMNQHAGDARRDALYMLGMSYYQIKVFSKAAEYLGRVTVGEDELTQNANLHLGLSYLQLSDKNKARLAFERAAASNIDKKVKEQAAYNYALCLHETSFSAFGESVTAFEHFLNEFPHSVYADKVGSYLVEVYMNTRSYDAALKSIERIAQPGRKILEAKQNIFFQLGTQAFADAKSDQALTFFNQSLALGEYNRQTKADASYWLGEVYYQQNKMTEAAQHFNTYLQLNTRTESEMSGLALYNLGYIAFHRKDYNQSLNSFQKFIRLSDKSNAAALADAYNRMGDCYMNGRQFAEAKRFYAQAESTHSAAGDYSYYQMALVAGLQKDYATKISLLDQLVNKYPESSYAINALYEKGRSFVLLENNAQAIASFKALLQKYPESPVARKAATEIGLLYYQQDNYEQAIAAYKQVVGNYPGSDEARLAMRDLKSIYVDMNRIDEFAALASSMPGQIRFDANEQDSLTYMAAEKMYMNGRSVEAKKSLDNYLKAFPEGAFGLHAHYYLTLMAYEQKDDEQLLKYSAKILDYPNSRFSEEVLLMRGEVLFKQKKYAEAFDSYKLLKDKSTTPERRTLAVKGMLNSAHFANNAAETIQAATEVLGERKLALEVKNEALYYRAKAYAMQKATKKAMDDWRELSKDTRNAYGAEARYLLAQALYDGKEYRAAEKELLDYIEQSTPHAYWLARSFVLLSDVYVALGDRMDARQYLLSLQQNYTAKDDIQSMIATRLDKLNK